MQLKISHVTKQYTKDKLGLVDFSTTIKNGVIGLLGSNGAGKSTLLRILATVSKPTSGAITLDGEDILNTPNRIRKVLGYLPQDFGVYPNLTGFEFLKYIAALKGVGGRNLNIRINQLLESVHLLEVSNRSIHTYSGGMKQRLGIAQVLLNDPKILIFDEPTVGLDPEERVRFRNLISALSHDRIILLSSHIISDIELIADEVMIMKKGILVRKGCQEDIIEVVDNKVFEIEISKEEIYSFKMNFLVISILRKRETALIRFVSDSPPSKAVLCKPTLEDAFLYLSK
ncbi:ABC transporter ATP-binding protein [Flavobacterium cyanobacteriorum]|uniref:ABC transporter ATP-binding protein n=1 Tax=Flavobacterium cyanobacteriorum TaxID=2022802 RepID=A0A255YSG7_9FLAO|nr:ABC transporter ATP-binding protein [Flavobacterium cyanobacteriorum]OYQ32147.1 ABC transporter ATP-binding protein [Flavobacterium cyanobacteriorum]